MSYTIKEIKQLKEMGFTNDMIAKMCCESAEVAPAKAVDEPPKVKYFAKAKNEVVMERDGSVCRPTYAGGIIPEGSGIYAKEIAAAIWYVNNKLIFDEFGDDVEFKEPKRGAEVGYVCKNVSVAKKLEKFTLRDYVTKAEWNAWVEVKTDRLLKEVERLESLKVK